MKSWISCLSAEYELDNLGITSFNSLMKGVVDAWPVLS